MGNNSKPAAPKRPLLPHEHSVGRIQRKLAPSALPGRPQAGFSSTPTPKLVQPKTASVNQGATPVRQRPAAPPVYRPEKKAIVQPKVTSTVQGRIAPKAPPVYRPDRKPGGSAAPQSRSAIQPKQALTKPAVNTSRIPAGNASGFGRPSQISLPRPVQPPVQRQTSQRGNGPALILKLTLRPNRAPNNQPAPTASAGVVQPKVGFEYEIGNIKTQYWSPFSAVFRMFGSGGWVSHARNTLLYQGVGYKIKTDEATDGTSQIELEIAPIDENDGREVRRLVEVILPSAIVKLQGIVRVCLGKTGKIALASEVATLGGTNTWLRFTLAPSVTAVSDLTGQLQMTVGMHLSKVASVIQGRQFHDFERRLDGRRGPSQTHPLAMVSGYEGGIPYGQASLQVLRRHRDRPWVACLSDSHFAQFAAVVAMMANIPGKAYEPGEQSYPKEGISLLARSDFATIIRQLPDEVLGRLQMIPDFLVTLVVETINAVVGTFQNFTRVATDDSPVFPSNKGWGQSSSRAGSRHIADLDRLSIRRWVISALMTSTPVDLLTKRNFPGDDEAREWLESLGEYGNKMDPGRKPIYEFRDLASGSRLADLPENIINLIDYLRD